LKIQPVIDNPGISDNICGLCMLQFDIQTLIIQKVFFGDIVIPVIDERSLLLFVKVSPIKVKLSRFHI
tara:strand:+ start:281 stop:484 length:204 start_codon:yes stop_codon:yes gene_type:complete